MAKNLFSYREKMLHQEIRENASTEDEKSTTQSKDVTKKAATVTSIKRRWILFKRMIKKEAWKFKSFKFNDSLHHLQLSLIDDLLFKIVSVLEAVVLVTSLCFFYLCCGCHF